MTEEPRHDPVDIELEQALLGTLFIDEGAIDKVAALLEPSDFFDPLHQRLFEMIVHLKSEGNVTPIVVHAVMKHDEGLKEVGGIGYLAGLAGAAPSMPNVPGYARVLKELSARRALKLVSEDIASGIASGPEDEPAAEITARAMSGLLKVSGTIRKEAITALTASQGVLAKAEAILRGEKPPSITTGSAKIDRVLGGMQAEDYIVVPARSGMGKTAFLGSVCRHAAMAGHPVMFFSREMSAQLIMQRTLCDIAHELDPAHPIHYWKFRAGVLSNLEIARLAEAERMLHECRYEICDEAGTPVAAIEARARAFAARHKGEMCLFAVDYLQNVRPDPGSRDRSREQEVSYVSQRFRVITRELGCPWVVAAQLKNKGGDPGKAKDNPPTADDIRESGVIEMDADIVVSPWRRAFFIKQEEPDCPHEEQAWKNWRLEYEEHEFKTRLLGFKLRQGDPSALNLDLWCDMGAGAFRDHEPRKPSAFANQGGLDFSKLTPMSREPLDALG